MKVLNKILLLALVAVFSFSCSGKDDDPVATPHSEIKSHTWTLTLRGYAGGDKSTQDLTFALKDVLGETDAKNITGGSVQNTGTYIEVTGLKSLGADVALNDFTLQLGTNPAVNLGKCTANPTGSDFGSDIVQSDDNIVNLLKPIFTAYTSKGQTSTLTVSFKPTVDITPNDKIVLKVTINGKYNWNTYSK